MGVDHTGESGLRQQIQELYRMVRRLGKATLNNASVGGGGIRVYDAGAIRFEQGGGVIINGSGYITIDGDLTGAGDFDWTGAFKARGPWELIGDGDVTGTVDWSGDLRLTGDIVVLAGGTIKAGAITIDPSSNGGSVRFAGGPEIYASGSTLGLYSTGTGGWVELDDAGARLHNGARSVQVTDTGFRLAGLPSRSGTGLPTGAIGADVDGTLWRAA